MQALWSLLLWVYFQLLPSHYVGLTSCLAALLADWYIIQPWSILDLMNSLYCCNNVFWSAPHSVTQIDRKNPIICWHIVFRLSISGHQVKLPIECKSQKFKTIIIANIIVIYFDISVWVQSWQNSKMDFSHFFHWEREAILIHPLGNIFNAGLEFIFNYCQVTMLVSKLEIDNI